jgi:hypothetical protein
MRVDLVGLEVICTDEITDEMDVNGAEKEREEISYELGYFLKTN